MKNEVSGLRVAHVQPMTLDMFGHDDRDFATTVRYSVPNLALAQAHRGLRPTVHMLASRRPLRLHVDGVEVVFHACAQPPRRLGQRHRFARQFSPSMLAALRRDRVDVVHFHGIRQFHGMYALVAARAERQGIPLVGQDRGSRPVGGAETAAQRYGLARTAQVLAASPDSARVLRDELGVPAARLRVIPNGVDPELFHAGPPRPPRDPRAPFRVLSVARLSEEKDPLTMAAGLVELGRRRPVEALVVSPGPLKQAVVDRLRDGGVPARFVDHVPQTELAERCYRWADAQVMTSHSEGWNQVVLEGMASGCPTVVTDIPGLRDAAGGAGLLVPPGDPGALATALERLADDPALWAERRDAGLRWTSTLTWDAVAGRLDEVYAGIRRA